MGKKAYVGSSDKAMLNAEHLIYCACVWLPHFFTILNVVFFTAASRTTSVKHERVMLYLPSHRVTKTRYSELALLTQTSLCRPCRPRAWPWILNVQLWLLQDHLFA